MDIQDCEIIESSYTQITEILLKNDGTGSDQKAKVIIKAEEYHTARYVDPKDKTIELDKREWTKKCPEEFDRPPHVDFINAMKMLRKVGMQRTQNYDWANFHNYNVIGVKFLGMAVEATANIRLLMTREITDDGMDGSYEFWTPPIYLAGERKWPDSVKVDELSSKLIREAKEYQSGKFAEIAQLTLKFEDGSQSSMKVDKP